MNLGKNRIGLGSVRDSFPPPFLVEGRFLCLPVPPSLGC